jgi:hypothetical protein
MPDGAAGIMFDNDLLFFKDKEESLEIIAGADILHFHHPFNYDSEDNYFGINFTKIAPKAKYAMHLHSTIPHYYNHPVVKYNKDIIQAAISSTDSYKNLYFLTTPHCSARYFPKAYIMPNIIDINDIDLRSELGILSRKWMEQYYNPKKLVKRLESFYSKVLHNEPIVKETLLTNKTRTFFQVKLPDIVYDYRKEKYQGK